MKTPSVALLAALFLGFTSGRAELYLLAQVYSVNGIKVTAQPVLLGDIPNTLSASNKAAGFKLLFDGTTTNGWHSFKKKTYPAKGWVVADGELRHPAKAGGGDLLSDGVFEQFELTWEWRITPGGNSGLKYFVTEDRASVLGHEYQMIDDTGHPDAQRGGRKHVTASFYDVLAPQATKLKPAGQWNSSRILVKGNHVEHSLNGELVLTYELGSDEVKAAVKLSKFKDVPGFGTRLSGHILLQDHGDEVAFRNIKIRELK